MVGCPADGIDGASSRRTGLSTGAHAGLPARAHRGPMSTGDLDPGDVRHWLPDAARASLLALGNFVAIVLMVQHLVSRFQHLHHDVARNTNFLLGSDLATPLIGWVWLLIVVNGLVLCVQRQTRATGTGLLVAAAVIAIPVVTWVVWTFATFASG